MSAIYYDGYLYAIVDGPSWQEAEANANKLGGNLVTIDSEDENEFLVDTFDEKISFGGKVGDLSGAYPAAHAWIGMNDKEEEGTYVWSSGEPVTYFEPSKNNQFDNGGSGGDDDYMGINLVGTANSEYWEKGMWEDTWNDHPLYEQGIAEIPFVQFGDSAYVLVEGPSWEEAQANAEKLGGNLVTINSQEENDFLSTFDNGNASDATNWKWIGFTDEEDEGTWKWSSGEEATFEGWTGPQPDDNHSSGINSPNGQDFAKILWGDNPSNYGAWDDVADLSNHVENKNKGIAEIPIDFEDYSTYGEEDYTDIQWHELNFSSFSSVKYQSLNWSYAEFNEFNDDTWGDLDWGKIEYSEFSSTSYTGIDWGKAKFNEFDTSDYKDINWGGVQFGEFNNSSYSSMDWGKVQYNELGNDDYAKLDWGKVQYHELGNDDYSSLDWGKVQYNEFGNDDYTRLDWGKIQYNELGNDDYTKLNWGKVQYNEFGNDDYTKVNWGKVQYNELGNDDYTKLHWGKVQYNEFGNDDYTKTAWNKVQMKEFGNDDYKAINWGKVQYNEVIKSTTNLNNVNWGKVQTNEWDKGDLKILTKSSTAKKLDKLKKAELDINVLKKGSSFKGDKDDDVITVSGKLLKKNVTVKGGKGNDTFVLKKGKGSMVIEDFKDKVDEINFAYVGAASKIKLKQKGKDTLIYSGKDLLATVKKTKKKVLTKSAFGLV